MNASSPVLAVRQQEGYPEPRFPALPRTQVLRSVGQIAPGPGSGSSRYSDVPPDQSFCYFFPRLNSNGDLPGKRVNIEVRQPRTAGTAVSRRPQECGS